jgi:hypothetical protein
MLCFNYLTETKQKKQMGHFLVEIVRFVVNANEII